MHQEPGEKRDFLPEFVERLHHFKYQVVLEEGYGSGMGFEEGDYLAMAPQARFAGLDEVYQQDLVLVLRWPGEALIRSMRPGTCLISMIHYPTRPDRIQFLKDAGLEAISLDSVKDDVGRRLVENLRSVAWNGVETAFRVLREQYPEPGFESPDRLPIKVTVLGAGAVGLLSIQAAIRYGDEETWRCMADIGATGVQVTAVDYDVTNHPHIVQQILKYTDILVDATQRPNPSKPVIPNAWIGLMRPYAVILDLAVDPYNCTPELLSVKGIEGIPQGNLDQYVFKPQDPAFDKIPSCFSTRERRTVVSCYSWPGIYPQACMDNYGKQLRPLVNAIAVVGGVKNLNPKGSYFQRALTRGQLSHWEG